MASLTATDPSSTAAETSVATTQEPSVASSAEPTTTPPASSAQPTTTAPTSSAETTTQPPTSSASPQSSAAPTSSQSPSQQSSAQPTTTTTSQQPTTSSSAEPSSEESSQAPSQAQSSAQSSAAPSSAAVTSASASSSLSTSQLTSAVDVTTTDSRGQTVTTRPSLVTQTSTSTDGNGRVYTITQVVQNPTGVNDSSSSKNGSDEFFDNTGAVAGTFVVVGLAVTAGVLAFIFFMLKRRRRQRLDRDVAAAAAAAAAAAHHSRRDMDDYDDEKTNPAGTYGGYYAGTDIHGEPQPSMGQYDYEDPTGGYDHYVQNLPTGDRMSTATVPGLAGFGAQSAQATYGQQHGMYTPQEGYEDLTDDHYNQRSQQQDHSYPPQSQGGYNAITRNSGGNGMAGGYYFDPKDASQYDYADEDAYGYNDQSTQQHPIRPAHHRQNSSGSLTREDRDKERGLTIANA